MTGPSAILSKQGSTVLGALAPSNVLLAFDYDGTLAPIARRPELARMRRTTRTLLRQVAERYPSVVISGRAFDDIARRVSGIPLWYVFGNHGSEPVLGPPPDPELLDTWVRTLRARLPKDPGIDIEHKGHSVTVHYRQARHRHAAREAIMAAACVLPGVRVIGGSEAVNLLRREAPNKGVALKYALETFACDSALYVGDDDTDEDAFTALPRERLVGIRVGQVATRAPYFLKEQPEIDRLLERLRDLRSSRFGGAVKGVKR